MMFVFELMYLTSDGCIVYGAAPVARGSDRPGLVMSTQRFCQAHEHRSTEKLEPAVVLYIKTIRGLVFQAKEVNAHARFSSRFSKSATARDESRESSVASALLWRLSAEKSPHSHVLRGPAGPSPR